MKVLNYVLSKISDTNALKQSSGCYETKFFDFAYRAVYLAGLSNVDSSIPYLIYSYTIKLMIALFIVGELVYLFSMSANLDIIIDNFCVTLLHLLTCYRYKSVLDNNEMYKNLATSSNIPSFDVSTYSRKKLVEFWVKRNIFYCQLLIGSGTCCLSFWYIYPLVDNLDYNLTSAVRVPFDYHSPKIYAVTYLLVLIAFNYTSYFVMVNDVIMQAHLMHQLCQFTVLSDCFRNLLVDCKKDFPDINCDNLNKHAGFTNRVINRFDELIDQHKFILSNTLQLKKVLSIPMLGQLGASSMLICFAAYQVTATIGTNITKGLMCLFYLGYNMLELFIFCRWCDEIKVQSEHIREAIYSCGWEHGGLLLVPGLRCRLLFVMARASKPVVLSAGGLIDLSLASYTTLVKTSYSALTVLLRLQD